MMKTDEKLDAKGLACPMPIVKARKVMKEMERGQVLEVLATDKGSTADMEAWAKSMGHNYLGTIEEGEVLKHYLRKSSGEEQEEKKYPHVISNEDLQSIIGENKNAIILDVRESAEYAFNHIPGALSLPLGNVESGLSALDKEAKLYVICRTGNRSDTIAQQLTAAGFKNVVNVVPGMSEWNGPTEKLV